MVFVDAAGNRMTVDVADSAAQPKTDRAPAAEHAPAAAAATATATAASGAAATAASAPASAAADDAMSPTGIEYDGEVYQDVDQLPPEVRKREGERFYQVPDGQGGLQTLNAATLGMGQPAPLPAAGNAAPFMQAVLPCPAGEPALQHLLVLPKAGIEQTLHFPVYDPTLRTRERYAGYRLQIPPHMRAAAMRLIVDTKNGAPDIVVVLVDADLRPWMVVNNKSTELIPETPFRYAMVAMEVPLGINVPAGSWLAVMEGNWARRVLAGECRPEPRTGTAVGGQLVIRFLPVPDHTP